MKKKHVPVESVFKACNADLLSNVWKRELRRRYE
jgi:hypothetical protein